MKKILSFFMRLFARILGKGYFTKDGYVLSKKERDAFEKAFFEDEEVKKVDKDLP